MHHGTRMLTLMKDREEGGIVQCSQVETYSTNGATIGGAR
jgi:hypothetical protein